jgi:uncharacterized protein YcbK (DUF882 family)
MTPASLTAHGPSVHLSWDELACHDGTAYPDDWRTTRAVMLAVTFEQVRTLLGGVPIVILSGYRTEAYNATLEGAASKSQHVQGRALDIWHPAHEPVAVYNILRDAQIRGQLPDLGGLGLYRSFVHLDVRPKVPAGHLATWAGRGVTLPVIA